jgi:hypothetical protein
MKVFSALTTALCFSGTGVSVSARTEQLRASRTLAAEGFNDEQNKQAAEGRFVPPGFNPPTTPTSPVPEPTASTGTTTITPISPGETTFQFWCY